ncbi:hypothetical protein [Sodalis glossinidius]|uniref:hypothetical protein n=1 Tax=Sodalis glossinidius TaxID=63612 RepID=UPI0002E2646F|nr:hypothetical protein [Sodalis glossinidius]
MPIVHAIIIAAKTLWRGMAAAAAVSSWSTLTAMDLLPLLLGWRPCGPSVRENAEKLLVAAKTVKTNASVVFFIIASSLNNCRVLPVID